VAAAGAAAVALAQARGEFEGEGKSGGEGVRNTVGMQPPPKGGGKPVGEREGNLKAAGNPGQGRGGTRWEGRGLKIGPGLDGRHESFLRVFVASWPVVCYPVG